MENIIVYKIRQDGVFDGDLEIKVSDPIKSPIPPGCTKSSPHPIPQGKYAYMSGGWKYAQGNPPQYPSQQQIAAQNKAQAESLLQATDWTATIDIADPAYSNPYLTNQAEFLSYRSQNRAIAVNPPITPAEFPNKPVEQWS